MKRWIAVVLMGALILALSIAATDDGEEESVDVGDKNPIEVHWIDKDGTEGSDVYHIPDDFPTEASNPGSEPVADVVDDSKS